MESKPAVQASPWERTWRYDAPVLLLAVVVLLAGWVFKGAVEGQVRSYEAPDGMLSLQYPAGWTPLAEKGRMLSVRNLRAPGPLKPGFWVERWERSTRGESELKKLITPYATARGEQLMGYRVLGIETIELDQREALRITSVYVVSPEGGAPSVRLVVVQAVEVLFTHAGRVYVLGFFAPEPSFETLTPAFEAILTSVALGS
jgi:hypothetical protein